MDFEKPQLKKDSFVELPANETYDVSGIRKYLKELENDPKKLEKFVGMARGRAKDIYESGGLDKEFDKGDRVVYAGAGTGHVPKYIKDQSGVEMIMLDIEDIRTPDIKEGNTKFIKANARELPFGDNSQDTICLFDMLHHTKNQQEILQEVRRVLKPGGKCLILEDTIPESFKKGADTMKELVGKMDDLFNKQSKGINPHNYHSISDWEIMFHEEGFDVEAGDTTSWYWGPADFMPESVRPKRPDDRTVVRPFESTLFKITKGDKEPIRKDDFTELEEDWFKKD